jgi:hypothetical protein
VAVTTQLSGADAGNYVLALPATPLLANITPRTLNVSLTAHDKAYDGRTDASLVSGDDRIGGDELVLGVSGHFTDKNVGSAKRVHAETSLSGADAGNYMLALPVNAPTASITPRTLNVSATAQNKVYDGGVAAPVSVADDRVAGDVLSIASSGAFANANAGNGKTVAVQVTGVSGSDAGNYVLAQPSLVAHADITPATLAITARDALKLQGDTLRFDGSEFSASGLVGGETIGSVSLASAGADASATPNRYAITPSAASGGTGFLASNYDISYRDGLLNVVAPATPASAQVNSQVVTFAQLFIQESVRQQDDRKDIGTDAIVITDTACSRP